MYGKEEYESRVQRKKMQQTEAESSWFPVQGRQEEYEVSGNLSCWACQQP
jgi:hypothetical protein